MLLEGKVAIVTGAAQGIGKSVAMRLAREGATVMVNGRHEETIGMVVDAIKQAGGKAFPMKADVSNRAEIQRSFRDVGERFGGIHILVNNAFVWRNVLLSEITEEDWDIVLNTGLKGAFFCLQEATRYMVNQRCGKIVNMSSVVALGSFGVEHMTYGAAKAGIIAVTKVAAKALGPYGINVNCIAPGTIPTHSQYDRKGKEQAEAFFAEKRKASVLGRVGLPEDIANLTFFLVSDESSFITGQVIACEGGRTDMMMM